MVWMLRDIKQSEKPTLTRAHWVLGWFGNSLELQVVLHSEIKIRACTGQLIRKFVTKLASLVVQSGKESACNAGDLAFIPGLERSPGERNGYPVPSSRLVNPTDRGAWFDSPWGHKESEPAEWPALSPFLCDDSHTSRGHSVVYRSPATSPSLGVAQNSGFSLSPFLHVCYTTELRTASVSLLTVPSSALSLRPSPLHPSTALLTPGFPVRDARKQGPCWRSNDLRHYAPSAGNLGLIPGRN